MSEAERAAAIKELQLELFEMKRTYLNRSKQLKRKLILIQGRGQKRCRKCRELMDVEQFYKDPRRSDGNDSYCIECRIQQAKEKNARRRERLVA